MWFILICFSVLLTTIQCKFDPSGITGTNSDEEEARKYIDYYDKESSKRCYRTTKVKWDSMINPKKDLSQELQDAQMSSGEFELDAWKKITSFAWDKFKDPKLRRWFSKAAKFGDAALPEHKLAKVSTIT